MSGLGWLWFAAYLLLGIGTARVMVANERADLIESYVKGAHTTYGEKHTLERARERVAREDLPPLILIGGLSVVFWPLVVLFGLILIPVGKVLGPLLAKWWSAPVERRLRRKGLT